MEENEKGRTLGGLQKEIEDLKQRIALMDATDSALCADLEHWKKVAVGLKGRNKQLTERIAHYKALDLEGDHLYEDKIAELDNTRKEIMRLQSVRNDVVPKKDYDELVEKIESKNSFIDQLQEKVQSLMIDNSKLQGTVSMNESVIKGLEETVDELSKPWWKKIF